MTESQITDSVRWSRRRTTTHDNRWQMFRALQNGQCTPYERMRGMTKRQTTAIHHKPPQTTARIWDDNIGICNRGRHIRTHTLLIIAYAPMLSRCRSCLHIYIEIEKSCRQHELSPVYILTISPRFTVGTPRN